MNPSPALLLFDATHTSHTRAQTGIQRVVRSLYAGLSVAQNTTGICFDPYLRAWRRLNAGELDHLRPGQAATGSRGAKWPLPRRLAGHARRLIGSTPVVPEGDALVCPELFSPAIAAHLSELFHAVRGPRVAIFHDAIGLKLPELSPPGTVARLPAYLRELPGLRRRGGGLRGFRRQFARVLAMARGHRPAARPVHPERTGTRPCRHRRG